jgi:hypothetical protein
LCKPKTKKACFQLKISGDNLTCKRGCTPLSRPRSGVHNRFIVPAQIGDSQILRQTMLGGHEVFDS